jgi:hypothetical protein
MKMIDAPSPRGTNIDGLKVPAHWFARPGLALDAAPGLTDRRSIAKDDDLRDHPFDKLANGEVKGGAADAGALLKKLEAGDALTAEELVALKKMLLGASEQTDDQHIESGPLDKPKPSPTATPPITDNSERLGPPNHDIPQDQMPRNAQEGPMGGRINTPIGMDAVLLEIERRLSPKRGDGMPSVSQYPEPSTAALGMDAAAVDEMDKMFGTARIGFV